jgi:ATP-dependent Clp protease adaptor protein ClpS
MTNSKENSEIQSKTTISEPHKYHVIFINDDFTPMDFVVQLLVDIFYHDPDTADELTRLVHDKGKAVVGTYSFEVAEQKAIECTSMARSAGHPLQVVTEAE